VASATVRSELTQWHECRKFDRQPVVKRKDQLSCGMKSAHLVVCPNDSRCYGIGTNQRGECTVARTTHDNVRPAGRLEKRPDCFLRTGGGILSKASPSRDIETFGEEGQPLTVPSPSSVPALERSCTSRFATRSVRQSGCMALCDRPGPASRHHRGRRHRRSAVQAWRCRNIPLWRPTGISRWRFVTAS
jgi:hypothetical protein